MSISSDFKPQYDSSLIELAQKFGAPVREEELPPASEGPAEEKAQSGTGKVPNARLKFAAASVAIAVWAILNLFWTPIARLISYVQHRSLFQAIEKARVQKLCECLSLVVEGHRLGQTARLGQPGAHFGAFTNDELKANILQVAGNADEKEIDRFVAQAVAIKDQIGRLQMNGTSLRVDADSVRANVAKAMRMPLYQALAQSRDCYAVNFLQFIAVKLLSSDGSEALRAYGKKKIGASEVEAKAAAGFQPNELADYMTRALSGPSFNADGFLFLKDSKAMWMAAHPLRAIHAISSHTHPLSYDSSYSNPHFYGHSFSESGRKVDFYYGAGPTGDPLFEFGVLPAYEKFGTFELRVNHQNIHQKADYLRIKDALRMDGAQHLHAVLSFDKPWVKTIAAEFSGVDNFFEEFKNGVKEGLREIRGPKEDNGVYIPDDLLDDAQTDLALSKAEAFCERLAADNSHWKTAMETKEGKKRMANMMALAGDSFLTLGMLYSQFGKITPEMLYNQMNDKLDKDLYAIRIAGACRQDVDRAVVENIALRLFFRWATDPSPLTENEVCEVVGAVLGRARLADNRIIQWRRYQILDDLLRFVGGCPNSGGVLMAHSALSEFREEFFSLRSMSERIGDAVQPDSILWTPYSWLRKAFG